MRYPNCPEVIATVEGITPDGDSIYHGDKIVSIQVFQGPNECDGRVDLDIRGFDKKDNNLVIRLGLAELMTALSSATLNADHDP